MLILAVVYLGNKLPKYVLKNLEYMRITFPDNEIYFISDSLHSIAKANQIGVKTWLAPDPDEQWKYVRNSLSHPLDFRDGFWFKTLARIFVLNSFLQLHPDTQCLQIEADVFLFSNFPFSFFKNLNADIAFPMESNQMGIASILFLSNHKTSQKLATWALKEISINNKVTDMSLLGQVAHSNLLNFLPLRTLPIELKNALYQTEDDQLFCHDHSSISGVFDGITIGQFLLGVDPRNSRGVLKLYKKQTTHAINPEKLNFELDDQANLFLMGESQNFQIYNLHNHSKDLKLYGESSRKRLLRKRVISLTCGEQQELIPQIFIISAIIALRRRVSSVFKSKAV